MDNIIDHWCRQIKSSIYKVPSYCENYEVACLFLTVSETETD